MYCASYIKKKNTEVDNFLKLHRVAKNLYNRIASAICYNKEKYKNWRFCWTLVHQMIGYIILNCFFRDYFDYVTFFFLNRQTNMCFRCYYIFLIFIFYNKLLQNLYYYLYFCCFACYYYFKIWFLYLSDFRLKVFLPCLSSLKLFLV